MVISWKFHKNLSSGSWPESDQHHVLRVNTKDLSGMTVVRWWFEHSVWSYKSCILDSFVLWLQRWSPLVVHTRTNHLAICANTHPALENQKSCWRLEQTAALAISQFTPTYQLSCVTTSIVGSERHQWRMNFSPSFSHFTHNSCRITGLF